MDTTDTCPNCDAPVDTDATGATPVDCGACGILLAVATPLPTDGRKALFSGAFLEHYELVRLLGRGGMGAVYLPKEARDRRRIRGHAGPPHSKLRDVRFVRPRHSSRGDRRRYGGATTVGDLSISATSGSLSVLGSRSIAATGNVLLETLAPGMGLTLTGNVGGASVLFSSAGPIAGAGSITAGTIILSAVTGIGSAATPIHVDTPALGLRNPGSGGAHVIDASLALISLDTQASTIVGDLGVSATKAAITVNSFGASADGDVALQTVTAGSDVFALGTIASGSSSTVTIDSAGGIAGPGFLSGGTVLLEAPTGIGSAATPFNVNAPRIDVQNSVRGGAFLNAGGNITLSGTARGDFRLRTTGDISLGRLSATGAFLLQADGSILNGAAAGVINLSGGAGTNSITAGAIIGTRSNPIRVNLPAGSLFADAINASADGVSIAVAGTVLPDNTLRLAALPGAVVFNDIAIFVPQVNLFTEGQLTFDGKQLFPSQFDLTQAALASAASRDAWSKDTGDRSMSVGGTSSRVYLDEDLAAETEDLRRKNRNPDGSEADAD